MFVCKHLPSIELETPPPILFWQTIGTETKLPLSALMLTTWGVTSPNGKPVLPPVNRWLIGYIASDRVSQLPLAAS